MATTFEIRVEGRLTRPTLHSLGCAHCLADSQSTLRLEATPTDLQRFLEACSARGLSIESVVRLTGPDEPGP